MFYLNKTKIAQYVNKQITVSFNHFTDLVN